MNDDFKNYMQLLIDNKDKITHLPERDIHILLDYITNLQETIDFQDKWLEYYKNFISENNIKEYKLRCEKAVEILGRYKHLSSPTEEQAIEQEEIVENAYDILKGEDNE